MAGLEENNEELNMDLIQLEGVEIPDEALVVEETTEEKSNTNVVDGVNQESVNNSAKEESDDSTETVNNEESPANDDNVFKMLTEFLSEQGLLSAQEENIKDIKSDEDFAKLMREQIKANEYQDLTDGQRKYLEALREGIPGEYIHENLKAAEAFERLTEDVIQNSSDVAKDLILEGLKAQGFDEAYALKHYKRVSDSGEAVEEAIMFRDKLKQIRDQQAEQQLEEAKKAKEEAVITQQKQFEELKSAVYDKDEIFGGFSVTKGLQEKVYSLMTKPVTYSKDGVPVNALMKYQQENPVEFQTSIHYLFELTDGFKNLNKFETKAATKAVNNFKSKLQKSNFITESNTNPTFKDDAELPDIVDII